MIFMMFFLLTIAILATVVYIYLRQEQDKITPQDKYDEAKNEFYKNLKSPQHSILKFSIRRDFLLAFLFTFGLPTIFTVLFTGVMNKTSIMDTIEILGFGLLTPIIVSLPIFLVVFFLYSSFVKNRRTFPFIYLAFIMLLITSTIFCCISALSKADFSGMN